MEQTPSYDASYKALFSCPELVRDLLRGYVPGKWLERADYDSLTRVNASYVSKKQPATSRRHGLAHRHRRPMAVGLHPARIPERIGRLDGGAADAVRQPARGATDQGRGHAGRPPAADLPIVLYNGKPAWRAPLDVADCFHTPPEGLEAYRPSLRYLLLDERRLQGHPEQEVRNFAEAVFRMEGSRRLEDALAVIRTLDDVLRTPGLREVRRAFGQCIKALLLRRATAPMIEEVNAIKDVFEEFEMLTQQKETWFDDEIEQSFLQGQEKGLEKGKLLVARNLLGLGQPVDLVVQVTGLSREVVQSMLH